MKGRITAGLALTVLAVAVWSMTAHPWGWLYGLGVHPYPESSSTPWSYQLWSGFIPALTVTTIFGAVITSYRRVNCHVHHCFRIGRYDVADGHFRVCQRHHPDEPVRAGRVTAEHIQRVHHNRLAAKR